MLAIWAASTLYAAYPDEYPIFLRLLGFSKDDIRHLRDGGLIKRSIHNAIPGESGIVAAQVSNIPSYYFLDYFRTIENFSSLTRFGDTAQFSNPPDLQDLKPLQFSKTELQDFLICRTGPCELGFTPEEIQTIPAEVDLATDSGIEIASNSYRRLLLQRVLEYREHGTAPQAAGLLKSQLTRFVEIHAYFPDAQEYLLQYPNQKKSSKDDLFYWSRESLGRRPVLSLHHVFSQRVGEDYILLNYVVYSNYFFDSAIGVIHLLNYADRNRPATLIVYELRTLVRAATKGPGRSVFGRSLEDHWTSRLKIVSKTLETRYRSREYLSFPYQLLPRDQR